ncbi:MAG TPA: hypothetical protein VMU39_28355 [Solirubrobacteraceae bacterium]|nr:hypothetical protein [Solirubrobacteraceae bacterium]
MAERMLPAEFSDLEPFVEGWCLDSEPERYAKRLSSTMDEIQAFYDAMMPRAEEAICYLEKFPLDDLPEDAMRLLKLLYSLILMSFPVEIWRQPYIPDTGTASFDLKLEPVP